MKNFVPWLIWVYFNPLGRKTETRYPPGDALYRNISIHSVARPRLQEKAVKKCQIHFNPLGRKTETLGCLSQTTDGSISIHSVARPRRDTGRTCRRDDKFQSTRSQDRDLFVPPPFQHLLISIHSVARPRLSCCMFLISLPYFNPLGRKTETKKKGRVLLPLLFQSTRSQDRDNVNEAIISCCCYFNPLGRKTETPLRNWPS